jgi:putative salt-induced outer membrane protein
MRHFWLILALLLAPEPARDLEWITISTRYQMKKRFFALTLTLALPFTANAESSFAPLSMQHKAHVELGTGMASGNIDNQNYSVKGGVVSSAGEYTNNLKLSYSDNDTNSGTTEAIYKVNDKLKYAIGSDGYAYGEGEYISNDPAGIDSRMTGVVGYGHNLITKESLNIAGEAGIGYRDSTYSAGLADESSSVAKVGTIIDWHVYDGVDLNNTTHVAVTEENITTTSDTSVKTFVYDNAYVKGGVEVENNSETPTGAKGTDTVTSVAVGYEF